jgi:hypothetical protein
MHTPESLETMQSPAQFPQQWRQWRGDSLTTP